MSWVELNIEVSSDDTEQCASVLEAAGACAVSYFDAKDTPLLEPLPGTTPLWDCVKVVGLFPVETNLSALKNTLHRTYPHSTLTVTPLVEQDWSRTWLAHFRPIAFGERLWVCPQDAAFTPPEKNAIILRLDPGLAFGTGTHPTTALCLSWLDKHLPTHARVVDYGCGSGILGIAALLLGAQKVWAVDYDPQALLSTRVNADKNHLSLEQCETFLPAQFSPPPEGANLVLANILAEPLITLAPLLQTCCAPGGHIVLSGLLRTQVDVVKAAYLAAFDFAEDVFQEDWALLVGQRKLL